MIVVRTPLIALCLVIINHLLYMYVIPNWRFTVALPIVAFTVSIIYGNGTISNLFAAVLITIDALIATNDWTYMVAVGAFTGSIAGSMSYLKNRLAERTEALTRQAIQIERLQAQAMVLDELTRSSDAIRRNLKYIQLAVEDISSYLTTRDVDYLHKATSKLNDVMTMIVGWKALDRAIESVSKKYGS